MYFYTCINLQPIEINTMFTGNNSTNFLDQILKRMDETLGSSVVHETTNECKETFRKEENPNREKLVLKFTRCNFDTPILDCLNEEELLAEFERRCEWKVSLPSSIHNNTVKENDEENKHKVLCKTPSSDENIVITLDDVLRPWSRESREKMRRLKEKEMDEVLRLCRPDYSYEPEIKTTKSKYLSDAEILKPCASTTQKKRISSYLKPSKSINSGLNQKETVFSKPLFLVGRKAPSLKKYKKGFREHIACKAGLKRFNSSRLVKQNQINIFNQNQTEKIHSEKIAF